MRVEVEDALFAPAHDLGLFELFGLGWEERHAILVDEQGPRWTAWIARVEQALPHVAAKLKQTIEDSLQLSTVQSSACASVRVVSGEASDWSDGQLALDAAIRLLRFPLRLLVENQRADFDFLLCVARPTEREWLREMWRRGWLEVQGAGGLGEIEACLQDLLASLSGTDGEPGDLVRVEVVRLRLWVMFDRDADPSDRSQPSTASRRVADLCNDSLFSRPWPLAHLQLARRTIESYLPGAALAAWVGERRGAERTRRQRALDALTRLRTDAPGAAFQYNMKRGFIGDRTRHAAPDDPLVASDIDPLFASASDADIAAPPPGFRAISDHLSLSSSHL
ncbi:MAG: hypothetical protein R3F43_20180 [bacterium]